jgi:large subunit ribosomal protein L29
MKIQELRSLSDKELDEKLLELKKEIMKNNGQIATGTTPKSPGHFKQLKKNIARIHTLKKERGIKQDD